MKTLILLSLISISAIATDIQKSPNDGKTFAGTDIKTGEECSLKINSDTRELHQTPEETQWFGEMLFSTTERKANVNISYVKKNFIGWSKIKNFDNILIDSYQTSFSGIPPYSNLAYGDLTPGVQMEEVLTVVFDEDDKFKPLSYVLTEDGFNGGNRIIWCDLN